jgi:hypothetical protein
MRELRVRCRSGGEVTSWGRWSTGTVGAEVQTRVRAKRESDAVGGGWEGNYDLGFGK